MRVVIHTVQTRPALVIIFHISTIFQKQQVCIYTIQLSLTNIHSMTQETIIIFQIARTPAYDPAEITLDERIRATELGVHMRF